MRERKGKGERLNGRKSIKSAADGDPNEHRIAEEIMGVEAAAVAAAAGAAWPVVVIVFGHGDGSWANLHFSVWLSKWTCGYD